MSEMNVPTVLIVDDEPDMLLLVRVELEMLGIPIVAEAIDGPSALVAFDSLDAPPIPHVVVLDNRMPGLSGMEVARQMLRRVPGQRIVLFSAYVDREMIEQAKAVGIRAVVSKTDISDLPALIRAISAS